MFRKEENKLEKWKAEIERAMVKDDLLENAIKQGFQRAKDTHIDRRKRQYVKRGIWSIVVAAILFLTLVTSIRVSPVMANAVASIPGMEKFVDFIRDDKGLASAIENEYFQALDISVKKEGVTVTIDGVIADEEEMIVFYTVGGLKKNNLPNTSFPHITDQKGNEIMTAGSSSSSSYNERNEETGTLNIRFNDEMQETEYIFQKTANSGTRAIDFEIPFSVDKEKLPTTRYPLNETVSIEDQKIIIKEIEISPIKVAIHVSVDPANTKEIFGFEDLRLVDENGETWTSINNGVTRSGARDDEVNSYYLQSNYFEEPKELYLQFNKLMAMDKDEAFLLIDTDNKKILKQPEDNRFSNLRVNGKFIDIDLLGVEGYHHDPILDIIDANGKVIHGVSGSFYPKEDWEISLGIELPNTDFESPLKFPLAAYPSYIEGNAKIKIK